MSDKIDNTEPKEERIAKRMSRLGFCSRRDAEKFIEAGRVKVDGKTIDTLAIKVTQQQVISVDGKALATEADRARVWIFHKPKATITSNKDPEGRKTIFDILPKDMPRVMTVGRLDYNSEGLLLLTNDGEVARHIELPATGWTRRYRVRVHGTPSAESLRLLKKGMVVDGVHYGSVAAQIDETGKETDGRNCWLTVNLTEGKNREIRKLFDHLGHTVSRLLRISYGPFQLGTLERGKVKEVPRAVLRTQLGKKFFP